MRSLKDAERCHFEKLLEMRGGFVLDYGDEAFGDLFSQHGVSIHEPKYSGKSRAKKLRVFWKLEPDLLVGTVMSEILDSYETDRRLNNKELDAELLKKSRRIVDRLLRQPDESCPAADEEKFLAHDFRAPSLDKIPIEPQFIPVIKSRLKEVEIVIKNGAHLSAIFLCGSILEAILLGAAQQSPEKFNRASASLTGHDKNTISLHEWSLDRLINVASELNILKPDVTKFSHGLRHFRNYIHPYQQLRSGFTPDEHTAKLCFQVLKAAMASLAGDR